VRMNVMCVVGVVGLAVSVAAGQEKPVAFVNARILTMAGDGIGEIEKGTVVVWNGRVVAAGDATVKLPDDAEVVDCTGKWIMPGLVDTHSHIGGMGGLGGADGSSPIQPEVRIYDSLTVEDSGFKRALAGGLTTLNIMPGSGHLLSGQTAYLKLRNGRTIEDRFIKAEDGWVMGGMKMANGTNSLREAPFPGTRGKSASLIREQYVKAQEYQAKKAKPSTDPDKAMARDLAMEGLGEVLTGRRIVQHHTHRADDIMTVLRFAKEFKARTVLHHVSEAWKVADEIAAADTGWGPKGIKGTPVSAIVIDTPGGKLEAAELTWETGKILEKAGVTVAFHTDDWITDSRLFFRSAALSVRAGMSRAGALRALTISGAKMLDLEGRVGSLEQGKDADLIILSGDPLSVYTKVEQTWVEGTKVFDRSDAKDRLYAVGGLGAGQLQRPYMCCEDNARFTFGGRQWEAAR